MHEHFLCFLQVLEQVRLPLLSPYYLYDRVEKAPIIRQTVACRELVEEAKTFHLLPDRRQELSSSRTRFRKSASKTCKRSSVLKYTSVLGKATVLFMDFRHVPELMSVIEEPGGSLQQSAVPYRLAELSGSLSVYQKFLSIPVTDDNTCSRTDRLHLLCSLSLGMTEVIVAVGGEDDRVVLRSVESFYPQARLWRSLARLPFAISKHGSVASGYNILYLAGGQYPDGSASRNVFKYDPIFDSWLEMSPMLVPRSELGMTRSYRDDTMSLCLCSGQLSLNFLALSGLAMLDGYIYAVGGWEGSHRLESVERYDVKTNAWQLVTPMKMALTSPAVAASNGYLYVTGENSDQQRSLSCL